MMECKFVVGQKVVCIMQGSWRVVIVSGVRPNNLRPPQHGSIYTIAAIAPDESGVILLGLKEFPSDHGFDHRGFRPLQDKPKEADTDISVFYPLLKVRIVETVEH